MTTYDNLKISLDKVQHLDEQTKNPIAYRLQNHAKRFYTNERIKDRLTVFILGFICGSLLMGSINVCYHLFAHLH